MSLTEEKRNLIEVQRAIQRIERTGWIMQLGIALVFIASLILILVRGSDIVIFQNYVNSIDFSHFWQTLVKTFGPLFGISLLIGIISVSLRGGTGKSIGWIVILTTLTALYIITIMKVNPNANFQANLPMFKISTVLVSITMGIFCMFILFKKRKLLFALLIIITVVNGIFGVEGIVYMMIFSIIAVAPLWIRVL